MYRVRVLAREGEAAADSRDVGAVVKERLLTARDARRAIGIPNAKTDTYRCVCVMNAVVASAVVREGGAGVVLRTGGGPRRRDNVNCVSTAVLGLWGLLNSL